MEGAESHMVNQGSNPSPCYLKKTCWVHVCAHAGIPIGGRNGGKGIVAGPGPTREVLSFSLPLSLPFCCVHVPLAYKYISL